jgi:predicted  nucleic acid-binding Zn-ribbon protein
MTSLTEARKVSAFGRAAMHGCTCVAIALFLLTLTGCRDSEIQEARQEVVELKNRVAKLEASLGKTKSDLADVREELTAAVEMRDTLDLQAGKLAQERDEALELAKTAEQSLVNLRERLKRGDVNQGQIAQLERTVQQLQATIVEQQTVIGELEAALQQQIVAAGSETEGIVEQVPEGDGVEGGDPDDIAP